MKHLSVLPLCFLFIFIVSISSDCTPLYRRLFFDPNPSAELKVDMLALFNTVDPCPDSYLHVKYLNSADEFKCKSELITVAGSQFKQYVHTCQVEIDSASPVSEFTYSIVPAGGTTPETIELASEALPFRLVITANTDMLNDSIYKPFSNAFQILLKERRQELNRKEGDSYYRINGIVLNGGFAWHFGGEGGKNLQKIMQMISQYSHKWPLFVNLGPDQILNKTDFQLLQKCFVLGGIDQGKDRTAMQGFSFARKVNLAFVETSGQYYSETTARTAEFNRTLKSLDSFFAKNQQNGNEFSIVFNHYSLFCSNQDTQNSSYNCKKGQKNLAALKQELISDTNGSPPTDLYVGAYQNNYERTYPYRKGNFMTLEQSRYGRGDFININEGTGGLTLKDPISKTKKVFTAVRTGGRAGFGILTIKGNGELKKQNESTVLQKQVVARKIYQRDTDNKASYSNILNADYLRNEDVSELNLFLLNYKHIAIGTNEKLVVQDVFRIVTDPQNAAKEVQRHQLTTQHQ